MRLTLPDISDCLLLVWLVQMYPQLRSTSLLPDTSDRLPWVRLVQWYLLHKSTSLLPDTSNRLRPLRLVQTDLLRKSMSQLPDSLVRLPWVMFLPWVPLFLFILVMNLCTHKLYMIEVH